VRTQLTWYEEDRSSLREYTTGVSIHGHTSRSRESLGFVKQLFESNALLRAFIQFQNRIAEKRASMKIDLANAYWTPPLCPRTAYELEKGQIEQKLGLRALVSLSDHDSIEAPQLLRVSMSDMPISLEWTGPFRTAKFHLGIHNLPAERAQQWMNDLAAVTRSKSEEQVTEILGALHAEPDVLLVFNHPLWNLHRIPAAEFNQCLEDFLAANNQFLHAF